MATGTYRTTLATRGLQPFLWTQFLGAFNDNLYKIVVSFYAIRALGPVDGMSVTAAVFVAPFLLFSGYAGHLADVRSKRSVLVWTKVLEIAAMLLALPALVTGRLDLQLAVLFLMATQATFFSPAKYGIVPEIAADSDISRVNGLLEMSTFAAIVLGTAAGGSMFQAWHDQSVVVAGVLIAIAIAGTLTSLWIPTVPPSRPTQRFNANPFGEIGAGLARLLPDRTLWMTVVGLSYFWFLGALLQQALMPWGQGAFGIGEAAATRLYTFPAIGIGLGSLLAGRLSGDKVELGLVPIGGFGLGVFGLLLVWTTSS